MDLALGQPPGGERIRRVYGEYPERLRCVHRPGLLYRQVK